MSRILHGCLAVGVALAVSGGAWSAGKSRRADLVAERAGWYLGLYLGEERGAPYPFVLEVPGESEGARVGIRPADEIVRVGEEEVRSLKDLLRDGEKLRKGRRVELWIRRGSQTLQFVLVAPDPARAQKPGTAEGVAQSPEKDDPGKPEDGKAKKKKKKSPIVIKPIPAPDR